MQLVIPLHACTKCQFACKHCMHAAGIQSMHAAGMQSMHAACIHNFGRDVRAEHFVVGIYTNFKVN